MSREEDAAWYTAGLSSDGKLDVKQWPDAAGAVEEILRVGADLVVTNAAEQKSIEQESATYGISIARAVEAFLRREFELTYKKHFPHRIVPPLEEGLAKRMKRRMGEGLRDIENGPNGGLINLEEGHII